MIEKYLVKVDGGENNNKFYHMQPNPDGSSFTVTWGRVGVKKGQSKIFPSHVFETKLRQKLYSSGYEDITDKKMTGVSSGGVAPEADPGVQSIINDLQSYSNKYVQTTYTVDVGAVTQPQIDTAQNLLNEYNIMITQERSILALSRQLESLWTYLPRKIADVSKAMPDDLGGAVIIATAEQEILDAMASQVTVASVSGGQSVSGAMGLELSPLTDKMLETLWPGRIIKDHDGHKRGRIVAGIKVRHQPRYDKVQAFAAKHSGEQKLLFHGSKTRNWLSIFNTGLVLNPSGAKRTGDWFGRGLYFAPSPMKSLGYTDLSGSYWTGGSSDVGYLAVFLVCLSRPVVLRTDADKQKLPTTGHGLNAANLAKVGYDTVMMYAGYDSFFNDEFVVYNEGQATVAALLKIENC